MSGPSILIVRYSALGDVVLATSVLDPLREKFPQARIEWVTDPLYLPLLQGLPHLSAVHALTHEEGSGALSLASQLAGRYDLAIDLQGKVRSAFVARRAGRRVVSFHRRTPGKAVLALLGSDPPLVRAHATELYAEALAPLGITAPGALHLSLSHAARALAGDALAPVKRPAVALAPGARWATKRWSAERFAAVGDALAGEGFSIVLAGGPSDRPALDAFRAALRAPIAADLTPLPLDSLAAALAGVDLLVACDSGPVHLATAVGTRAVVLFGPTSTVRWGPPPPSEAVSLGLDCAPCTNHGGEACPLGHHRCMAELDADRVIAAAKRLLAR